MGTNMSAYMGTQSRTGIPIYSGFPHLNSPIENIYPMGYHVDSLTGTLDPKFVNGYPSVSLLRRRPNDPNMTFWEEVTILLRWKEVPLNNSNGIPRKGATINFLPNFI